MPEFERFRKFWKQDYEAAKTGNDGRWVPLILTNTTVEILDEETVRFLGIQWISRIEDGFLYLERHGYQLRRKETPE